MSSNQNNPGSQNKRMRSVRWHLAATQVWKKIIRSLGLDITILLVILVTWLLALENAATGTVDLIGNNHDFTVDQELYSAGGGALAEKIEATKYVLSNAETGKVILEAHPFKHFLLFFAIFIGVFVSQIVIHWCSFPVESGNIKKILEPLDDMVAKAEELAKFDFTEDKYHVIEDKINSLEPDEESLISLGDEDLAGIERAMNSLLKRIRDNNRQQARFVNDASHELRTPIAVIQGYANMLARWGREDEKVLDESITAIQNESENMKHLVEQLLFLARGDAGRTAINKTKVDLNALMNEVYEESLMIDENHIYKFNPSSEAVFVNADEGLIKQAVRILVDNAAKYTKEKDEIILGVGVNEENRAFLRVQDSGIGMKEADVEHMFERFYRADEARSFNGTGLGLSIAKWIVDKHEGHFEVVSREDLGTRIGIYLNRA
ncbi:MAG: HAMP domain-containing histidine kinase [Lachnospiraceae bacterium]|nr:HAMP domain-containing histidine kinase [Lachnospiraceae bacterium]